MGSACFQSRAKLAPAIPPPPHLPTSLVAPVQIDPAGSQVVVVGDLHGQFHDLLTLGAVDEPDLWRQVSPDVGAGCWVLRTLWEQAVFLLHAHMLPVAIHHCSLFAAAPAWYSISQAPGCPTHMHPAPCTLRPRHAPHPWQQVRQGGLPGARARLRV